MTRKDKIAQSGQPDHLVKSIAGGEQWTRVVPPVLEVVNELPHSYHEIQVCEIKESCKSAKEYGIHVKRAEQLLSMVNDLPDDHVFKYYIYKDTIYTPEQWARLLKLKAFL